MADSIRKSIPVLVFIASGFALLGVILGIISTCGISGIMNGEVVPAQARVISIVWFISIALGLVGMILSIIALVKTNKSRKWVPLIALVLSITIVVLFAVNCARIVEKGTCSREECNKTTFKNGECKTHYIEDVFLGCWKTEYICKKSESGLLNVGEKYCRTVCYYEDGTGEFTDSQNGVEVISVSFTWDVSENCEDITGYYGKKQEFTLKYSEQERTLVGEKDGTRLYVFTKE